MAKSVGRRGRALDRSAAKGLALRHDHRSNYMSRDFQVEIRFLGVKGSPAFVRGLQGNGVAERFIESAASRPFFRAACDGCCDARLRVEGIGLSLWLT